ncbi:MAG: hypothetical protein GXN99_03105 [Candidatus Nanohaloarchaeota archaeon]|nr:hypothetical protein [Candidatus Nanohaloarchaeota archaeon]
MSIKRRDFLKGLAALGILTLGGVREASSNASLHYSEEDSNLKTPQSLYLATYMEVELNPKNYPSSFFYVVPYLPNEKHDEHKFIEMLKSYLPKNTHLIKIENSSVNRFYDVGSLIGSFIVGISGSYGLTKLIERDLSSPQSVYDAVKSGGYLLGNNKQKLKLTSFGKVLGTMFFGIPITGLFYRIIDKYVMERNTDKLIQDLNSLLPQKEDGIAVFVDISPSRYTHLELLGESEHTRLKHFPIPQEFYEAVKSKAKK